MQNQTIIGSNLTTPVNPSERAIGDVIAMQLAGITYCSLTNNVASTLKYYLPDWQVVWSPTQAINGNWAFIAYNGVQYVVAIRGSILQFSWAAFDNWFEQDFNLLEQTSWNYTDDPGANPMISRGASDGLNDLIQLTDANGDTILGYLMTNAVPHKKFIGTVGHSLGGNLATVYSMYLRYQILQAGFQLPTIFSVLTFAAPTSWNLAFANEFDSSLTNTWRYYGMLDIVPFSACDIIGLGNLYPPTAPAAQSIYTTYKGTRITLAEAFDLIQAVITASEIYYDSAYFPVNSQRGAIPLNTAGQEYKMTYTDPLARWFEQAGQQHDHNHYLDWLGGTGAEVVCR